MVVFASVQGRCTARSNGFRTAAWCGLRPNRSSMGGHGATTDSPMSAVGRWLPSSTGVISCSPLPGTDWRPQHERAAAAPLGAALLSETFPSATLHRDRVDVPGSRIGRRTERIRGRSADRRGGRWLARTGSYAPAAWPVPEIPVARRTAGSALALVDVRRSRRLVSGTPRRVVGECPDCDLGGDVACHGRLVRVPAVVRLADLGCCVQPDRRARTSPHPQAARLRPAHPNLGATSRGDLGADSAPDPASCPHAHRRGRCVAPRHTVRGDHAVGPGTVTSLVDDRTEHVRAGCRPHHPARLGRCRVWLHRPRRWPRHATVDRSPCTRARRHREPDTRRDRPRRHPRVGHPHGRRDHRHRKQRATGRAESSSLPHFSPSGVRVQCCW